MKSHTIFIFILLIVNDGAFAERYFSSPTSSNNYIHDQEIAFIPSYEDDKDTIIHYVDFRNKRHREVIKSDIGAFSINHTRTYLAHINKFGKKITVIKIANGDVLYTGGYAGQEFSLWADNKNLLTYFDARNNYLYIVNIDDNSKVSVVKAEGELISAIWDNNCQCFYYQFMPIEEPGLTGVFRIIDGKLEKTHEHKSLLVSPDGRYYLLPQAVAETGNYLQVYDTSNDEMLRKYDTGSLLWAKTGVIWKKNIIRMIGNPSGSIELDSGAIVSSRNGDVLLYDTIRKYTPFNYSDLASDYQGYVLMWNRKDKLFEVEDVGSGKTIKTYNKFW